MKLLTFVSTAALLVSATTWAADDKVKAAAGAAAGGAVGAVIGDELGDRQGAIIGAAAGAAIGAAIATDDGKPKTESNAVVLVPVPTSGHPHGCFCPPGQAKKNRC
jgi:outer membrane lipoprotein SlyB